jgi:hypothetical protein
MAQGVVDQGGPERSAKDDEHGGDIDEGKRAPAFGYGGKDETEGEDDAGDSRQIHNRFPFLV